MPGVAQPAMWKAKLCRFSVVKGSICVWLVLPLVSSCGSTAETVTGPSQVRCSVQAQTESPSFTVAGGTGTLRVTTNRECTWSAQSEAPWLTLTPPMNGQGEGTVQFTVGPNGLPASRATAIKVEEQRLQISQEGRPCEFRVSSTLETVEAGGGDRTVQVTTTTAPCRWTANSDVPWITITSGREGNDTGAVTFRVDPLSGPARTGTVTIAGQVIQVQQGAGCSYTVGTDALNFGAAGGPGEVTVSAPPGCSWTAQSAVPWITVTGGGDGQWSGRRGPAGGRHRWPSTNRNGDGRRSRRDGDAVARMQCHHRSVDLRRPGGGVDQRRDRSRGARLWLDGGDHLGLDRHHQRTKRERTPVRYGSVSPETQGQSRVGTIGIAGQTLTVNQSSGCAVSVNPASVNVGAAASASTIQVTSAPGCTWAATSGAPWIALGDSSSGSGNGQVPFSVLANAGPARQGTLSVGGRTVTVAQASGCIYTVTPPSQEVAATGGTGTASICDRCRLSLERVEQRRLDHCWHHDRHRFRAGAVDGRAEQ